MAIETQDRVRGGKGYTVSKGTADTGLEALFIRAHQPDAESGQALHYGIKTTTIEWDPLTGQPVSIYTQWQEIQLSNSGKPLLGMTREAGMGMYSNKKDLLDFSRMFGKAVTAFSLNGWVRKVMGYNRQPMIDATLAWIPDTAYDTAAEPTHDYDTHNADGTPINPA